MMQDYSLRGLAIAHTTEYYMTQHTKVPSPAQDPYSDYERLHDGADQSPSNAESQPPNESSDDNHHELTLLTRGSTDGDDRYHTTIVNGSLKYEELLDGNCHRRLRQSPQLTSEKLPDVLPIR